MKPVTSVNIVETINLVHLVCLVHPTSEKCGKGVKSENLVCLVCLVDLVENVEFVRPLRSFSSFIACIALIASRKRATTPVVSYLLFAFFHFVDGRMRLRIPAVSSKVGGHNVDFTIQSLHLKIH